ncbi:MAG: LysR family transcriptional regulator [Pseudomonadota bacterium]
MSRFRELSAFMAVAEEGAFNAAARSMKIAPSAVTRLVNQMEARIGARLFTRTTRRVSLTEAGERLRAGAAHILEDMEAAEASAAGAHQRPSGHLRLTAPVLFGQQYILPLVRDFLDAHPDVTASAILLDRVVHLIDEGFDVGLRIGELPDSALFARQVSAIRRVVVASPEYLDRYGAPQDPGDLERHSVINTSGLHGREQWQFVAGGKTQTANLAPRLSTNGIAPALDAAIAGWGLTRVLSYQVHDALAGGVLTEVLGEWEDRQMPTHLIYADGRQASAKVRAFVDMATEKLRNQSFG